MKKNLVSILITNYNKGSYIKKTLNSCIDQNFKNKEILVFDDVSTDNSYEIIKKFSNIRLIRNKKKKFKSPPLNQINGIIELFKKSKGELIFLLDGDDLFKKNKLSYIYNIFAKDKKINFLQDRPFFNKYKSFGLLKKKKHYFSIWPSFYPTSSIVLRRNFFLRFLKFLSKNQFPNLEIDARLAMFAYYTNNLLQIEKSLTIYSNDFNGITSNYKKFSKNWWLKRLEAFQYLKVLLDKLNIYNRKGFDYYFTKLVNFVIK